jgi:arsenate reductase
VSTRATIYHNPDCGTSRNVLSLLRHAGGEPKIVEYLKTPPSRTELSDLIARAGLPVRAALRRKGGPYDDLGLANPALSDADLFEAMHEHPILLNRPFVVTSKGAALCRPSDLALNLLDPLPEIDLRKEDGDAYLRDEKIEPDEKLFAALAAEQLPTADLNNAGRIFYRYFSLTGELQGFGGFEPLGAHALLRSIVVPGHARGSGVGRTIVALLLRRAFDAGARTAYVLSRSAEPFFGKMGFEPVVRECAPPEILETKQACEICPADTTLLMKPIAL